MSLLTAALWLILSCVIGIYIGIQLDQKYGPNNVAPDCAGTILIYTQDGEAYLFLDTELSPEELAKNSTVMFKVETQDPQLPL